MKPIDIKHYSDVFKVDFLIWEAEALMKMSSAYVEATGEYDGVDCLAPATVDLHLSRQEVSDKLSKAFARRAQSNKRSTPNGGRK